MSQIRCPHCGQLITPSAEQPTAGLFPGSSDEGTGLAQAQLMQYARDLAKVYAVQKRMARYLPSGLRERIRTGEGSSWITGQRRQVTVLFADLADFTRLTARMEAEETFDLLNTCFRQIITHIYKYGGEVDKFLGDGVMAVFGIPEAHEDDPARAVHAALDMDVEMRRLSRQLQAQLGGPLQLHIGIHCGEVIAGNVGVDEQQSYTVVGTTVNLAFRLQEISEPGMILVSQAVQQATQHLFRYRYYRDAEIKGFAEPVPVFALESRLARQAPPTPHFFEEPLPWAGRHKEMEQLKELAEHLAQGEGGVILIEGEPGLGKTRLVREWLTRHTPSGVQVWISSAHMVQSRIAYSVWRQLTRWGTPGAAATSSAARTSALPSTVITLALNQLERFITRE
ncbi:MAG: adenylate/guanylate cyclase domain-containing protein, partial [Anaerolineae bacterium]